MTKKKYNEFGFLIGIFFFIAMLFIVQAYSYMFSPVEVGVLWLMMFLFVAIIFYLSVRW